MVDIVIYTGGNNGNIHRSLKHCIQNFKTSLENIGIQNQYILYLEQKNLMVESPTVLNNLIFLKRHTYTFNELVMENLLFKK